MTEIAVQSEFVTQETQPWWRTAVVYQVYIRSFADGNGDGIGDLAGLRSKLGYLADLGVDAIWINPWYPSPMVDAGYDVADFRDIEPDYGTLAEAEALLEEARAAGIRVIIDIVPNHTSHLHAWFQAALRDEPGARDRYIFREGRGERGELPPNDWTSNFGGPAWTRLDDGASEATGDGHGASEATGDGHGASEATGDAHSTWYLHLFAPEQPDLNWENPEVRADFEDVLRFWFDRGVDGFRIDVAHGLAKDPAMPDAGERDGAHHLGAHPAYDQDAVHEVYRGWRAVANSYADKVFVAEAWVPDNERLSRYLRPDELHTAFQFDFLRAPWRADLIRAVIDDALAQAEHVGAPATWVLSNHDVPRVATRYARSQPEHPIESEWERARWAGEQPDLALGRRRARAAALLQLALPGTAYVYQGEELGLRSRGPAARRTPGPDLGAVAVHRCRSRRLSDPVAVLGRRSAVRLFGQPHGAAVAAAAGGVGCAHRCRAGGRPDVDVVALPGRAAVAARAFRRRRTDDVARRPGRSARVPSRRTRMLGQHRHRGGRTAGG